MAFFVTVHAATEVVLPTAAFSDITAAVFSASTGATGESAPPPDMHTWRPAEHVRTALCGMQAGSHVHGVVEAPGSIISAAGVSLDMVAFHFRVDTEDGVDFVLHQLASSTGVGNEDTPSCGSVIVTSAAASRPSTGSNTTTVPRAQSLADAVTARILSGTAASTEYCIMTAVAAILAALGLVTNNAVVVVASMLVSPMMGPVLGLTFGAYTRDRLVLCRSAYSETVAVVIAITTGVIVGGLASLFDERIAIPTLEMQSRGEAWGLLLGCAIAIPSGIAVALSVIGDNVASLVGIAISASILPPLVNTGICLCYAARVAGGLTLRSQTAATTFASMGALSALLTLVNIACIVLAAMAVFWIKSVKPFQSRGAISPSPSPHTHRIEFATSPGSPGVTAHVFRAGDVRTQAANMWGNEPPKPTPGQRLHTMTLAEVAQLMGRDAHKRP